MLRQFLCSDLKPAIDFKLVRLISILCSLRDQHRLLLMLLGNYSRRQMNAYIVDFLISRILT